MYKIFHGFALVEAYQNLKKAKRLAENKSVSRFVKLAIAIVVSLGEFYQFNLSSCIRQQNSLTAQFVSFSLANLANIFYPPRFLQ